MNERTWRRAAAALIVCGAAVGSWFGMVSAQPMPKVENAVWTRSATPSEPAQSAAPVIQAKATMPVLPAALPLPVSTSAPPLAKPKDQIVSPEFKAVPPKSLPLAVLPAPDPVIPTLPELAPSAQPAKSVEPVKPVLPLPTDFNLHPSESGNSVKSGGSAAVALPLPVVPPSLPSPTPALPRMPEPIQAPPLTSVSRPKPVEGPMPATEKFVFPIPAKPNAIVALPTVTAKPELLAPELLSLPLIPATPTGIERPKPEITTTIPTPGVDPVNKKQATLATVIGGALAMVSPAAALPLKPFNSGIPMRALPARPVAADPVTKTVDEKLADAQKEIKRLAELVEGRKDTDGKVSPVDVGAVEEVKRLKDKLFLQGEKITALEKQIDDLKKSTSLKPSIVDPMAGKGTVRVVNEYPVEITIVVNNTSYRVAPTTKLDIPVPAGDFSYQLLNSGIAATPVKSTIEEKKFVTLRIK